MKPFLFTYVFIFYCAFVQGKFFISNREEFYQSDEAENIENIITKIYGGGYAKLGQFPYFALLYINVYYGYYTCGGSVIDENFILTVSNKKDKKDKFLTQRILF